MPGSKREISPGVWELRVEAEVKPNGRRRQVSRRFKGSARGADKKLAELWRQVEADEVAPSGKMTFGAFLDKYLAHLETLGRSPRTVEGYRGWRRRELADLERVQLDRLKAIQIDALYADMLRRPGMDPLTVIAVHALIHGALKQARKWQLVKANVADDVTKPRVEKRKPSAPSSVQVRRILSEVQTTDPDYAVYLRLSAASGCRRGEVVGFQWRDVDCAGSGINVERSVVSTAATGIVVKDTKTHQKDRLPLDAGTMSVLKAHRARCEERARVGEVELRPESFLFSMDLDGSRCWHPDTPTGRFRRLRARIGPGVAGVQLRQFRHYVGTQIMDSTGNVKAAQAMLRHASPTTTLNFYAAEVEESTRSASTGIGNQLDQVDEEAAEGEGEEAGEDAEGQESGGGAEGDEGDQLDEAS